MKQPVNARFWTWAHDGFIKITLRPGQSLSHHTFSIDSEGGAWSSNTFTHAGDRVINQWGYGGRDCDGRISETGVLECTIEKLGIVSQWDDHWDTERKMPEWKEKAPTRCRDQFAELANY